jgi:hypothetical protein
VRLDLDRPALEARGAHELKTTHPTASKTKKPVRRNGMSICALAFVRAANLQICNYLIAIAAHRVLPAIAGTSCPPTSLSTESTAYPETSNQLPPPESPKMAA